MVYGLPPNARELAAMAATRATLPASIVGLDDERHDRLIATLETGFWVRDRVWNLCVACIFFSFPALIRGSSSDGID